MKGLDVRNTGILSNKSSLFHVTTYIFTCTWIGELLMCPLVGGRECSLSSLRQDDKSGFDLFGKGNFNG